MADNDFKGLADKLRQYGQNAITNANKLKRRVALAVDTTVVLATPVDTGRARANWQASVGVPAAGVVEAAAPGTKGSTGGANAQAAIEQAQGVVAGVQPEQAVILTNNLPYIGRLNDGWSAQAPASFVQKAVLVGIQAVQAAPGIVTGDFDRG